VFINVPLPVVLGEDDDPLILPVVGVDLDLHFHVGVDADVENLAILGEPGIRPTAVVADADGGHAVESRTGESGLCRA
jgi:hypothetical protein